MSGDVTPYTSLITAEYQASPNYLAVVAALLQPSADQQAVYNTMATLYGLDTAVGSQLDTVGVWIGPSRYLEVALTGVYFSFDVLGQGFDQGVWAPDSGATVLVALPDDEYRLLLYATVAANHWDGDLPDAETLLNNFWNSLGYYEYIVDNQDMTMTYILIGPPLTPVVAALYYGGYLDVRPAGVGTANHFWILGSGGVPAVPIFGFDIETPTISGFDVGYWDGLGGVFAISAIVPATFGVTSTFSA